MYTLSPSSLNLFKECPRCFWLQVVKRIRRPFGIFPSLPSGIDNVLKNHFDTYRGKSPPELASEPGILYPDKTQLAVWRNNRKGLRYEEKGFTLVGAIDDLFVSDQGYVPLDFKTRGYPLKDDTVNHYQLQMDLYTFLLEKNNLPPAGFALLLFYHPDKVVEEGLLKFHTDLIKLPTDPARSYQVFQQACELLKGPEPPLTQGCEWCRLLA